MIVCSTVSPDLDSCVSDDKLRAILWINQNLAANLSNPNADCRISVVVIDANDIRFITTKRAYWNNKVWVVFSSKQWQTSPNSRQYLITLSRSPSHLRRLTRKTKSTKKAS